ADNAIARVSSAVAKAAAWKTPTLLNDTTRYYFERLALVSSPEQARIYNGISNPDTAAESLEYLRLHEPVHYSMLHTSISPTMIQSGYRANVIPAQAEATLDIRAAPGEDIDAFFDELARQIGDDGVQIERMRMTRDPAPPSALDSLVYRTFEELQK